MGPRTQQRSNPVAPIPYTFTTNTTYAPLIPAHRARRLLSVLLRLPIPRSTFYRWLENGLLPSRRIFHRRFIQPADLDAFVRRHTQKP